MTARVLQASESVKGADKLRKDRQAEWPYTHLFPPPGSDPVHVIGSLQVPVAGTLTTVLAYQVPEGFRFWLRSILQAYTLNGAPGPFNPGDTLWTVDVNAPVGIPNVQGTLVQGLVQVPVPLGSWVYGTQWPLEMPYPFESLDLLQSKALNVNLGVGGQNWYVSGFFGYLVKSGSR